MADVKLPAIIGFTFSIQLSIYIYLYNGCVLSLKSLCIRELNLVFYFIIAMSYFGLPKIEQLFSGTQSD